MSFINRSWGHFLHLCLLYQGDLDSSGCGMVFDALDYEIT